MSETIKLDVTGWMPARDDRPAIGGVWGVGARPGSDTFTIVATAIDGPRVEITASREEFFGFCSQIGIHPRNDEMLAAVNER